MPSLNRRIKAALPNPVKRAVAHALRPIGAPRRLQNLLAFDGEFALPLDGKTLRWQYADRWIERDLFWHGWPGYEPVSLALWHRAARGARTIIDIGANSGIFGVSAKVLNPSARVIAFEPLPLFADALARNARRNAVDVQLVRAAVSSTEGKAQFFVPEELAGNIYSSSLSREHYDRHQASTPNILDVDVVMFDRFAEREDVRTVDLVKIDAEGHDAEVLAGMAGILARDHPDCIVEIQSDAEGARLMPHFEPSRYAYFNLSESGGPRRVARLGRSDTVNFFICKHETASALGLPGA